MGLRGLAFARAAALAAAGLAAAGCVAEEPAPADMAQDDDRQVRRQPTFGALDADGDGAIAAGEIDAAPASLAALDEDGDGRLSADELRPGNAPIGGPARPPADATAAFMAFDGDGNDALEAAELPSPFRSLVARADADGDAVATEAEILALMTAEAGDPPDPRPAALLAALDVDGDGTLSAVEIVAAPRSLRGLDSDGDGRLTAAELRPAAGDEAGGDARSQESAP